MSSVKAVLLPTPEAIDEYDGWADIVARGAGRNIFAETGVIRSDVGIDPATFREQWGVAPEQKIILLLEALSLGAKVAISPTGGHKLFQKICPELPLIPDLPPTETWASLQRFIDECA